MIKKYLDLVKFSHSIFALPFALIGYTLAAVEYGFSWLALVGVLVCMVLARSAAMGFNRLIDREFDARNPRTAAREIPSGKVTVRQAQWLVGLCSVGFMVVAAMFNTLTLLLSPVALAVVLGYSYTKRFTWFCHLILGIGLAIAPSAAYIALSGTLSPVVVVLSVMVWSWVAGFDVIFALQDAEFDKSQGLYSLPVRFGVTKALIISAVLHCISFATAIIVGIMLDGGILYWIGAELFSALLVYQHIIVKPGDLSRVNLAFGLTNGVASVIYATFVILSLVL